MEWPRVKRWLQRYGPAELTGVLKAVGPESRPIRFRTSHSRGLGPLACVMAML